MSDILTIRNLIILHNALKKKNYAMTKDKNLCFFEKKIFDGSKVTSVPIFVFNFFFLKMKMSILAF